MLRAYGVAVSLNQCTLDVHVWHTVYCRQWTFKQVVHYLVTLHTSATSYLFSYSQWRVEPSLPCG